MEEELTKLYEDRKIKYREEDVMLEDKKQVNNEVREGKDNEDKVKIIQVRKSSLPPEHLGKIQEKMKNPEAKENLEITKKCPRFSFCDVAKCPLDKDIKLRVKLKEDRKCGLSKRRRIKIGKNSDLPYQGMTKAEWVATERFRNLSSEEKEKLKKRGVLALKKLKSS